MRIEEIIRLALEEDLGSGDHTSLACIASHEKQHAKLLVKEHGIISGIEIAREVFRQVNPDIQFEALLEDGVWVQPGDIAFKVHGDPRSILAAERLALNIMQRMSGIATLTHRITQKIKHTSAKVLDTRKTTPLLRILEKQAVKTGGGENHRFGLYDMIMIKDNHIDYAGGIAAAIERVTTYLAEKKLALKIEIEVRDFHELTQVLEIGGVHRIMLDNFNPFDLKKAIDIIGGRFETEASGGITEATIGAYAETGVNYISMGGLTHSVKSLDLSLKAYYA